MTRTIAPALLLILLTGCAPRASTSPYAPRSEASRNPAEAERLTQVAARTAEPDAAERLLRDALAADLYCGPAHNNLGALLLARSELFEAANEFEWATKLMPGHPSPRLNLAITLERAGRTTEALAEYRSALESQPEHIQTIQALTRLQIRSNSTAPDTADMLRTIAFRGETEQWRTWANAQLTRMQSRTPARAGS